MAGLDQGSRGGPVAAPVNSALPSEWARYFRQITRWIPIESGNYPYVTARVRAKKAALLSQDTYERMLQMEIPQIARVLSEGAYKAEILAAGSMRESFLRSLIELPSLDEVFDRLEGTIHSQALLAMGSKPSEVQKWNEWEDRLTKLYYDNLLVVIPERTEGTRLMREFVRREIDIVNLRTLLRLWASKATLRYDPFVDGGLEIPKAELAEMISLDLNGLTARLRDYALTEDLAAQIKDLQALGGRSPVGPVQELHLREAGRYAHVHPLSVLPILDYIVRKDREVQNLRLIARGKESGLASDVIRELLVI